MSDNLFLSPIIDVDEAKCVNCNVCISVCPVKYCNDASGEVIKINHNACIGCGKCVEACTHDARFYIDDFQSFIDDVIAGVNIVAVVSPVVVASFPGKYLHINSFLKKLGVSAVFDAGFGAELTAKSYVEYIEKHKPKTIISSTCPAIVNYIEIYQPGLIKYLAPFDSPIVHTIKMIKKYYPQYADYKVAVISPCVAQKNELETTGYGDYNVTIESLDNFLKQNDINLDDYKPSDYDNPPAERAVMFTTHGGLTKILERQLPDIDEQSRKISGVDAVYDYLKKLPEIIEQGKNPLIIDCLSCENGCNQGISTLTKGLHPDETDFFIKQRSKELKEKYLNENENNHAKAKKKIEEIIAKYWEEGIYNRTFINRWKNFDIKYPTDGQIQSIYTQMLKTKPEDIQNCAACGYGTCDGMATAIHNGLNKMENCQLYVKKHFENKLTEANRTKAKLLTMLETAQGGFIELNNDEIIVNANDAMKKILKKSDIIGRSILEFLDNRNLKILLIENRKREKGKTSSYELQLMQSDGNLVPVIINAAPLYDFETHEKIGSFAMVTDISHLKKIEKELKTAKENLEEKVKERTAQLNEFVEELKQQKEELLTQKEIIEEERVKIARILEMLPNPAFMIDKDGKVTFWNKALEEMTGVKAEEIIGKGDYEYAKPFYGEARPILINLTTIDDEFLRENYKGIKKYGNILQAETYVPAMRGEERYLIGYASAIYDRSGEYIGAIEVIEDFTERQKQKEKIEQQREELQSQTVMLQEVIEELSQQKEELQTQKEIIEEEREKIARIIEMLPNPAFIIDKDGIVTYWNKALEEMTGVKAEEIIGKGDYEYAKPFYGEARPILINLTTMDDEFLQENYKGIEKHGNILQAEAYVPAMRGKEHYLVATAAALYDKEGSYIGAIEVIRDFTERQKQKEKIEQQREELQLQTARLQEMVEELQTQKEIIEEEREKIARIIEMLPNPAFIIDKDGIVTYWNKALEEMTGVNAEEIIGKGDYEYAKPFYGEARPILINLTTMDDEFLRENYKGIEKHGNILQAEAYVPAMRGKEHYLVATAAALYDKEGNYIGAIEVIRDFTERQYYLKEIETHRKKIIESINYAKHIQEALLPQLPYLKNFFNDYFLFFKPRDIVSGDFYWIKQRNDKIIVAVADCTGHGVPGAMMSMLGMAFLEQIEASNKNIAPDMVLNKLREMIMSQLGQDMQEGMDITLIIFDKKEMTVDLAAANNPVYLVSDTKPQKFDEIPIKRVSELADKNAKLYEFKADRMPVGNFIKLLPFNKQKIKVKKGDRIYMFSDGFIDLYNRKLNKKYTAARFKELLLSTSDLKMSDQGLKISESYKQWLADSKQIDDIIILGIEI